MSTAAIIVCMQHFAMPADGDCHVHFVQVNDVYMYFYVSVLSYIYTNNLVAFFSLIQRSAGCCQQHVFQVEIANRRFTMSLI